ncbi:BLOC-1-related complex subunit 7-like [Argopecten irradians]|uniref:BLOC-1-related complex subunit 7-like n=1 Tax=Argopecten irradians TaxID=31199 RepID=UPI0037104839
MSSNLIQWNAETKTRLNEKVAQNMADLGSLTRYIVRSSKSSELLSQAEKNFSYQENIIQNSSESLKKMMNIKNQLEFQQAAVVRSMSTIDDIQDILMTIQR